MWGPSRRVAASQLGLSLAGELAGLGGQPTHTPIVVGAEPFGEPLELVAIEAGVELARLVDPAIEEETWFWLARAAAVIAFQSSEASRARNAGLAALGPSEGPGVYARS